MSPAGSKNAPEAKAREKIDVLPEQAGWLVKYRDDINLTAGEAIAVREFKLEKGHGFVDYLLFLDGNAIGVVEAKPAGYSFTSVEFQAKKYVEGLPASLTAPRKPLPFAYISTGSGFRGAVSEDRKSTRLNSSHGYISYAVFCLTKKITVTH